MGRRTWHRDEVLGCLRSKFHFRNRTHTHGQSHLYLRRHVAGVGNVDTHLSWSRKDIGAALLSAMARQLKVSTQQFHGMLSCTVSDEDYVRLLRQRYGS